MTNFFKKIARFFASDEVITEEEPVVALPVNKAEDDHFVNGVKRIRRFRACCADNGCQKMSLESEWTYSEAGYLTEFISYTTHGNVYEHNEFEYNGQNNVTKEIINGRLCTQHLYDETGINCIEELTYDENGSVSQKWVGEYDGNKLVSGTTYTRGNDGSSETPNVMLSRAKSSYDDAGNLACTTLAYDDNPSLNSKVEMQYDDKGQQTQVVEYGSKGETMWKNTFDRNSKGQIILECQFDSNGCLLEKYESDFDLQGNLVKWTRYGADGTVIVSSSSIYKYDEKGNYTEQVNFENEAFDSAFIHEIEYYS